MLRGVIGGLAVVLVAAPAAAASLPEQRFGERPGPPLLYAESPTAPELSVSRPFRAEPLLVSGTDALRDREYLYQDYLFDDHGADTVPGPGNQSKPGPDSFSPAAGDVAYPTGARFGANAADLVEFRVRPTTGALVYRITLNTVKEADTAIVGIGVDEDRSGGAPVAWPGGTGVESRGLDSFITAWGTGGTVTDLSGGDSRPLGNRVEISRRTNQMTIRVPRSMMDPGDATWRYVAGVGLHDGKGGFEQVERGSEPRREAPTSGSEVEDAPAVFNLAFRFNEPQIKGLGQATGPYRTFPGVGNWFEDRQAHLLSEGRTGQLRADVNFSALEGGTSRSLHAPGRDQARIFASGLDLPEGVREQFPEFGGRLQPYLLTVPRSYDRSRPAGLTFSLHSLGGTYTQYAVFSPNQLDQFGPQRDNLVVTPLAHGPDGWYTDEAEVDLFEVWRDVAAEFRLDPSRAYPSGYSMGGYGTYKLGVEWPDLFARAFTTVGPPGEGVWVPPAPPEPGGEVSNTHPLLENVRWLPYMNWVGQQDQLVPYVGPTEQQNRFDRLGLRSTLETFQGEHFTLAVLDEWGAARDFLGDAQVERRPSRIDYAFFPGADRPRLGLVHDHAYWVYDLRARDESGDPQADPARAELGARSQAFGEGAPRTQRVTGTGVEGRPSPSTIRGTEWTGIRDAAKRNRLVLKLANIGRAKVDGRGAKLDGERPLRVRVESDGEGRVRLELALPGDAVATRIDGPPVAGAAASRAAGSSPSAAARAPEVSLDRAGATFHVARGEREYLISTGGVSDRPGEEDDGAGEGDTAGDGGVETGFGGGAGGSGARGGGGGSGAGGATDATVAVGGSAGAGGGPSLPFTGLALGVLSALGLAALAGGRALRRASS